MDLHVTADRHGQAAQQRGRRRGQRRPPHPRGHGPARDARRDPRSTGRPRVPARARVRGGARRAALVDPYTFDPDLDMLLETDVRSHDQDYHVSYAVTGPFSDWRTSTSSDPALAQADINALLLFGLPARSSSATAGLGTALLAETGDLLFGAVPAPARSAHPSVDRWNLVSGVSERGSTPSRASCGWWRRSSSGSSTSPVETNVAPGLRDRLVRVDGAAPGAAHVRDRLRRDAAGGPLAADRRGLRRGVQVPWEWDERRAPRRSR